MSRVAASVVTGPDEIATVYVLRHAVFVDEQGVPVALERDECDPGADHVLAWLDGLPMGAGRLVVEDAGYEGLDPGLGPVGHLGRLAVLPQARGHGLGVALVATIEGQAAAHGLRCVYLGAQTHALGFYTRLGYVAFGPEFDDAGLPHRHMWRPIDAGPARAGMRSAHSDLVQSMTDLTSTSRSAPSAAASGTFLLGGDLPVNRLGFGAMRITGRGIWGPPDDHGTALAVLRRAVELGVDFIDTADSYGPNVSEDLIREALHPYDGVVVATKGGFTRQGPDRWVEFGQPAYLRQCVEMSLRRLGVEQIDLYQLHRIDPAVPLADQVGELRALQDEGKIRHLGLSQVSVDQLEAARRITPIVSVQNLYNLADRASEALLDHAEAEGIAFIPWFPIANRELARSGGPLAALAARTGHTPAQLALAWLLRRSQVMLPIPGTGSLEHLEDNVRAGEVALDDEVFAELSALASG